MESPFVHMGKVVDGCIYLETSVIVSDIWQREGIVPTTNRTGCVCRKVQSDPQVKDIQSADKLFRVTWEKKYLYAPEVKKVGILLLQQYLLDP